MAIEPAPDPDPSPLPIDDNPPVSVGTTFTRKRGRCRVINNLFFQKKKGNCRSGSRLVGKKHGSIQIYSSFLGTKKGRAGVSLNSFVGRHHGSNRVLNYLTTRQHGLAGVSLILLGSKKGHNTIHWFFGGLDHRGRTVVAAPVPIENHYTTGKKGKNRIANAAIEGYVVWVGVNVPPDINSDPDGFTSALPIRVMSALPSTGGLAYSSQGDLIAYDDVGDTLYMSDHEEPFSTEVPDNTTLHIIVRRRDMYGLVSQNQRDMQIVLTPTGRLLPKLQTPQSFILVRQPDNSIMIKAVYPGALRDEFPATQWAIWNGLNEAPDTSLPPDMTIPVRAQLLSIVAGPYNPGTYFVSIALYRATDGAWTDVLTLSITLIFPPTCPIPVLGGYQLECDCATQHPVPLDAVSFTTSEELIDIGGGSLSSHD